MSSLWMLQYFGCSNWLNMLTSPINDFGMTNLPTTASKVTDIHVVMGVMGCTAFMRYLEVSVQFLNIE